MSLFFFGLKTPDWIETRNCFPLLDLPDPCQAAPFTRASRCGWLTFWTLHPGIPSVSRRNTPSTHLLFLFRRKHHWNPSQESLIQRYAFILLCFCVWEQSLQEYSFMDLCFYGFLEMFSFFRSAKTWRWLHFWIHLVYLFR